MWSYIFQMLEALSYVLSNRQLQAGHSTTHRSCAWNGSPVLVSQTCRGFS